MQLLVQLAVGAVDDTPTLHRRTAGDILRPALDVLVAFGIQELRRAIDLAQRHAAKPWPDGDIRDAVLFPRHVATARQLFIQHVEQAFGFHREAVNRVLNFHRRIVIEVTKTAAEERGGALQPEQPVQGFYPARRIFWQEVTEFLRQIKQDIAGFKHAGWRCGGVVAQGRNFGVRVDLNKPAGELIPLTNTDQPCVIFRTGHAQRQ